jgi:hypothetical protein
MKTEEQEKTEKEAQAACEKLVDSQKLVGSAFQFVCRCKLCGWQTMQNDEESGKKLVKQHALVHWPEIQAHSHE